MNKNIKFNSFESNGNTRRQYGAYCAILDNKSSSVALNKLAMNVKRLSRNFVDLTQGSANWNINFRSVVTPRHTAQGSRLQKSHRYSV